MVDTRSEKRQVAITVEKFFCDPAEPIKGRYAQVMAKIRGFPNVTNITDILSTLGMLGVVLAGGAITAIFSGGTVNDLDFYLEDPSKLRLAEAYLKTFFTEPVYVSDNCITFKRKSPKTRRVWTVQLITRFSGHPVDIFDNFDFTITTGAYSFREADFTFGDRFFPDLAKKRLVYMGNSKYPICAMYRTKKYQERGYFLPGSTVMHISLAIVRLEIKTYAELKKQLLGIDTVFLQNLLKRDEFSSDLPVDYGLFVSEALEFMNVTQPTDE